MSDIGAFTGRERRDIETLMRKGSYPFPEAVRIATGPKVRISFWNPRATASRLTSRAGAGRLGAAGNGRPGFSRGAA